jgi:hypothetical protein
MAWAGGSLVSPVPISNGVSREARMLWDEVSMARSHLFESLSLSGVAEAALAELEQVRGESSSANWDGYGGRPLDLRAYAEAVRFLTALPPTTPPPALGADPDGEVEISWNFGPRSVFSVSVGPTGRLTYAGLFGMSKSYGTEWLGSEIPRAILESMARVFAAR